MSGFSLVFAFLLSLGIIGLLFFLLRTYTRPQKIEKIKKLLVQKKYRLAISKAQRFLARNPRHTVARYLLARAFMEDGKLIHALEELKTITDSCAEQSIEAQIKIHESIAQLYIKFQQTEEALKEYATLIDLAPGNAQYHYCLGNLFIKKKSFEAGKTYLKRAILLDSRLVKAYLALISAHMILHEYADAEHRIEDLLKIDSEQPEAIYHYAQILREKRDYIGALSFLDKIVKEPTLKEKAFIERGWCYMDMHNENKAITEFERALGCAKQGSSHQTLLTKYFLSLCLEKTGRVDDALQIWQELHAISPTFKDVAEKLRSHESIILDDGIKDYTTSNHEGFMTLCAKIVSQYFHGKIKQHDALPQGCVILAQTASNQGALFNSQKNDAYYFLRDTQPADEAFLRTATDTLKSPQVEKLIIISSSGFSPAAVQFSENRSITLYGQNKLSMLLKSLNSKKR